MYASSSTSKTLDFDCRSVLPCIKRNFLSLLIFALSIIHERWDDPPKLTEESSIYVYFKGSPANAACLPLLSDLTGTF